MFARTVGRGPSGLVAREGVAAQLSGRKGRRASLGSRAFAVVREPGYGDTRHRKGTMAGQVGMLAEINPRRTPYGNSGVLSKVQGK